MIQNLFLVYLLVSGLSGCKPAVDTDQKPFQKMVINISPNPASGLVSIASKNQRFRQNGLDVELKTFNTGKAALEHMMAGDGDFAVAAETPLALAIINHKQLRIVANIGSFDRSTAIIARRDRGIRVPRDLAGKTLGLSKGTSGEYLGHLFLMANGMEPNDVTIKDFPPERLIAGLDSGEIDAACLWHPDLQTAIDRLGANGIVFESDMVYIWTFSLVGQKDYLEAHPGAVRALIRSLLAAQDDYGTEEDRIFQMIADVHSTPFDLIKTNSRNLRLSVSLNQSTISVLDDNLRWVGRVKRIRPNTLPNPLDYVYWEALEAERPEALTIIRTTKR